MQQPTNNKNDKSRNHAKNDNAAIFVPILEEQRLIHSLPPCNVTRLWLELMAGYGLRGADIEKVWYDQLDRDERLLVVYRMKNQKGRRYLHLTPEWLSRYDEYRDRFYELSNQNSIIRADGRVRTKLFHVKKSAIDKELYYHRQTVGGAWARKRKVYLGEEWTHQYVLNPSGMRHTYITHHVRRLMLSQGLGYEMALRETMREMQHHDARMTARYQVFINQEDIDQWADRELPLILLMKPSQRTMNDWYDVPPLPEKEASADVLSTSQGF